MGRLHFRPISGKYHWKSGDDAMATFVHPLTTVSTNLEGSLGKLYEQAIL